MMQPAKGTLIVFDDAAALARGGAEWLLERALESRDRFVVALSGGSTPKALYRHLGTEPIRSRFPWERTHWVLGDERFVPPGDPASNFGMICGAFLGNVPAPPGNVHPMPTMGVTLEEAAEQYEATLRQLYGADRLDPARPLLDVAFQGLGTDGHTASLMPGQPVLRERERWVGVVSHGVTEPRLTLTYPVLESSRHVVFLVSGEGKRTMLDRVLSGGADVPAARLLPQGSLLWMADRDAAGRWADA